MTDIAAILSTVNITTFLALLAGTGIGRWWKNKSTAQKKSAFNDALTALGDKKLTVEEMQAFVDKHF